jgi:hypothetical protein
VPRKLANAEAGGAPRSTPEDILAMAQSHDLVAPGSKPVIYLEQLGLTPNRIGILLTTHQLMVITNHVSDEPELAVYDEPKEFTITGGLDGTHIIIAGPNTGAIVDAKGFAVSAAIRLKDMMGAVRFGIMDPEHDVPTAVRFENIKPIEFYEAVIGPNARHVVQTMRHDKHRFELLYVSDNMHGYLVPRWFVEGDRSDAEVPGFFQPLRNNVQKLTRSARRPFHLEASALQVLLENLRAAGLTSGPKGYQLRRGESFDHVTVASTGKTYSFTKEGKPVVLTHPAEPGYAPAATPLLRH